MDRIHDGDRFMQKNRVKQLSGFVIVLLFFMFIFHSSSNPNVKVNESILEDSDPRVPGVAGVSFSGLYYVVEIEFSQQTDPFFGRMVTKVREVHDGDLRLVAADIHRLSGVTSYFDTLNGIIGHFKSSGSTLIVEKTSKFYGKANMEGLLQLLRDVETEHTIAVMPRNSGFSRHDLVVDRNRMSHMRFPTPKIRRNFFVGPNDLLDTMLRKIIKKLIPTYANDRPVELISRSCISMDGECRNIASHVDGLFPLRKRSFQTFQYPSPIHYVDIPMTGSLIEAIIIRHTCPSTQIPQVETLRNAIRDPDFKNNCDVDRFIRLEPGHGMFHDNKGSQGHFVSAFRPTVDRIVSGYLRNKQGCYQMLKRTFTTERIDSPFDEGVLKEYARLSQGCTMNLLLGRACCSQLPITDDDIASVVRVIKEDYAYVFRHDRYEESANQFQVLYGTNYNNLVLEDTIPTDDDEDLFAKAKAVVQTIEKFTDDAVFNAVVEKWDNQADRVALLESKRTATFTDIELKILEGRTGEL